MKIKYNQNRKANAFTLIEMIGVLAVIAILAALLIPKVFEAINNARVNNTIVSYNTVKAACIDHYAKFGAIDKTANGVTLTAAQLAAYDTTLLSEGFLDKPFIIKVGTNSFVQVTNTASYLLDGTINATSNATYVVEAVIQGVPYADAKDINDRLDSDKAPFTFPASGTADNAGRVKWDGSSTVRIYLTHR